MENTSKKIPRRYPINHNPCRGCVPPKRHLACHSTCKERQDWLVEWEEYKEWEKKERMIDNYNAEFGVRLRAIRKNRGLDD